MAYSLSLQDYISAYHPLRVPVTSQTSYTNQFIKSADEYEQDLRNLYTRLHAAETLHSNAALQFRDKMDLMQEEETAFLIEKSNQQTFLTFMAGTILTGLLYTALLILKPTETCSKLLRTEQDGLLVKKVMEVSEPKLEDINLEKKMERENSEEKSVTANGLLCSAASEPFKTALAVVWIPIILFTVITGYMVRNVAVGSRVDDAAEDIDSNIRTNIVLDMDAETLQKLIASNHVELTGALNRNSGQLDNFDYLRF